MVGTVLAGLLDDKLTRIISLFLKHPEKRFYLSEIARMADVNTATTFRILNKIVAQDIVKATVIGKARTYQLVKGERTQSLSKMLKKEDDDSLVIFIDKIKVFPKIRLVLLDSKSAHEAKLIIIGDFPSRDRIERVVQEVFEKHKFKISFAEFNPQQYKDMRAIGMIGRDKKILYRKTNPSD